MLYIRQLEIGDSVMKVLPESTAHTKVYKSVCVNLNTGDTTN